MELTFQPQSERSPNWPASPSKNTPVAKKPNRAARTTKQPCVALKLISDSYFDYLQSSASDAKIARDYLASRGINDESRKHFRIGFAPDSWSYAVDLLKGQQYSGEVAHACGVASPKRSGDGYVDMFRGRLMFPIQDLQDDRFPWRTRDPRHC